MKWIVLLIFCGIYHLYICLGGLLFHKLESQTEEDNKARSLEIFLNFLMNHTCVDQEELVAFVKKVAEAQATGSLPRMGNGTVEKSTASKWNYFSSVFFATTVTTTIGFGSLSPSTRLGQIACVIYALFGIPLLLAFLSGICEKMQALMEKLSQKMEKCFGDCKHCKSIVKISMVIIGLVLFFIIPSVIFSWREGWQFSESMYFSFISLSTIGFGDYVPSGHEELSFYQIYCSLWVMFGMAWIGTVFATIQTPIQSFSEKGDEKVGAAEEPQDELTVHDVQAKEEMKP